MTLTDPASVPDLQVVTPANWIVLDLEAIADRRQVERLIGERVAALPELEARRDDLVALLTASAEMARAGGVVFAAVLIDLVGPWPVLANMTIAMARIDEPPPDLPRDEPREPSSGEAEPARRDVVELPAGWALRVEGVHAPAVPGYPLGLEILTIQYRLPIPGTDRVVFVTFTSPMVGHRDKLADVFDGIARSLEYSL